MSKLIARAVRENTRFKMPADCNIQGSLNVIQLYEIGLQSLDELAQSLQKQAKGSNSFLEERSAENEQAQFQLDVVVEAITYIQEQNKAKQRAAELFQKRKRIAELMEQKKAESLSKLSLEELEALMDEEDKLLGL